MAKGSWLKTFRFRIPNFTLHTPPLLSEFRPLCFGPLSAILPQQALARGMVASVNLQMAVETPAIEAAVV